MAQDALFTPAQVAELVGVTPSTVRRWIREGSVRALKIGPAPNAPLRVPASELVARMRVAEPEDKETT